MSTVLNPHPPDPEPKTRYVSDERSPAKFYGASSVRQDIQAEGEAAGVLTEREEAPEESTEEPTKKSTELVYSSRHFPSHPVARWGGACVCKGPSLSKQGGYTEGYVEVATFTREDVYLEYSARDIEEEYLWGETYEEMEARTEPYRGPGGLLGGGTH